MCECTGVTAFYVTKAGVGSSKMIPLGLVQSKPAGVGACFPLMLGEMRSHEVCSIRNHTSDHEIGMLYAQLYLTPYLKHAIE